jgi:hypothetical protein
LNNIDNENFLKILEKKVQNTIMSHSPQIGNTTSNYLGTLWRTMPEKGQLKKKR